MKKAAQKPEAGRGAETPDGASATAAAATPAPPAAAAPAPAAAPGPAPAAAPASPPADPRDVELALLRDRLLRLQADFDNYRKRQARERAEIVRCANEDLIEGLLPVLDHFELGLKNAGDALPDGVRAGLRLVHDQFLAVLRRFGLEGWDAEGEPFDPGRHESIALAPSETVGRDRVAVQARRGYRLGGQVLRPAQVVVSSGPPVADSAAEDDAGPAAD